MTEMSQDRRRDDRLPVGWEGEVILPDDRKVACRVADISTAGTKIESAAAVAAGDEVLLSLPELGDFAGKVQWVKPPHFGLALQAGPDLLLKRVAEDPESYPTLAAQSRFDSETS